MSENIFDWLSPIEKEPMEKTYIDGQWVETTPVTEDDLDKIPPPTDEDYRGAMTTPPMKTLTVCINEKQIEDEANWLYALLGTNDTSTPQLYPRMMMRKFVEEIFTHAHFTYLQQGDQENP